MKKALLLLNMGGAADEAEIKLFLTNMFNDKNIIPAPAFIRRMIAWLITKRRFPEAAENYKKIGGKSPILGHTQKLVAKLQTELGESCRVACIMRYTPPRAETVLRQLQQEGIDTLYLLPLYPHYSTTTTKSSFEDIDDALESLKYSPDVVKLERFFDDPLYNDAVVETITEALGTTDPATVDLIFSAHSLPQKVIDRGDPYQREIEAHVHLLSDQLRANGILFKNIRLAYQSKLGPVKWLEPSLESLLEEITTKRVLIVPLSFTVDNSETDFELAIEYREFAEAKGFETYGVCRCPNASDSFVAALKSLYEKMRLN